MTATPSRIGQLVGLLLLLCLVTGCATTRESRVEPYLDEALDFIEDNALHSDDVDWLSVRSGISKRTANATQFRDVWGELEVVVSQAGGPHSSFWRPVVASALTSPSSIAPPTTSDVGSGIVKLTVPSISSADRRDLQDYIDAGLTNLAAARGDASCGWIIDFRGNVGGNMWPMLAVVSPFFPAETVVAGFQDRRGGTSVVTVSLGSAELDGKVLAAGVVDDFGLAGQRVALLLGRRTASSGEIVASAFDANPHSKSFGVATGGFVSGNDVKKLEDGSAIVLTTSRVLDGEGRLRPEGPLSPDVTVATGHDAAGEATAWLHQQCTHG